MKTSINHMNLIDSIAANLAEAVTEESKLKNVIEKNAVQFYLGSSIAKVSVRCIFIFIFIVLGAFVPMIVDNLIWIVACCFLYVELLRSHERISSLERLIVARDKRILFQEQLEKQIAEQSGGPNR